MKKIIMSVFALFLIVGGLYFISERKITIQAAESNEILNLSVNWQGISYTGEYEGKMKNGVPEGTGRFEGDRAANDDARLAISYEGEWKNGQFNGKGRLEDFAKKIAYEGTFKKGMLDGSIKIFLNKEDREYTLVDYKKDVPRNVSWECDEEGDYLDYDCYYRGISIKEIRQKSRKIDYGELVYNSEDNLFQKIQLQCRVEYQGDVRVEYQGDIRVEYQEDIRVEYQEDDRAEYQRDATDTLIRYVVVSDKNGNNYLLQYDLAFASTATNYMPFLKVGQEMTVYGYYIGLKNTVSEPNKYPCIQAVFAENENGNNFDAKRMNYQYESFLNYPYQYKTEEIELEAIMKGIYGQTDKKIFFLVESKSYSNEKDDLYVCAVKRKSLSADQIPSKGEKVIITGKLQLLIKYDDDDEGLSTFVPLVDSTEVSEERMDEEEEFE